MGAGLVLFCGQPSPYTLVNADQPCRCMAAYPRHRVFPLAYFSVMLGLVTISNGLLLSVVCQIMLKQSEHCVFSHLRDFVAITIYNSCLSLLVRAMSMTI